MTTNATSKFTDFSRGEPAAPFGGLPAMSSDQVLEGKVLADAAGLESGQIISFRILEKVGEGGMGIVYRARQAYPSRIVALKVVKAASASPRSLMRFEREIAILARLQHPCIAQLFSVGVVESNLAGSLPFLAMEFVEGVPITTYVATRQLDIRQRVELMARVCEGVSYAQSRGVIHRDLKPSNILVTYSGQLKILDFGLATLTTEEKPNGFTITEDGQLLGTIDYMSPEQASGKLHTIDQRTDVYALGVVLFEVLTGKRPVDLSSYTMIEALQQLQSVESTSLAGISRVFRGDLDIIAGKALAKDRDQRYASVAALGEDLQRFLANEPIKARRPTAAYCARKFVRRHRLLVASVSAVVLALSFGLVMTARESIRANREAANARTEAANATAESRKAKMEAAEAALAEGDALLAGNEFDAARRAYNESWDNFQTLGLPTMAPQLGIWEVDHKSGRPIRVLEKDAKSVQIAAISKDDRRIALGFIDGRVQCRSVQDGAVEFEINANANPQRLLFSPDGKLLLVSTSQMCEVWDIQRHAKIASRQLSSAPTTVALTNSTVAFCDSNGNLFVSQVSALSEATPISLPGKTLQAVALADDSVFVIADRSSLLHEANGHVEVVGSLPAGDWRQFLMDADARRIALIGNEVAILELPSLKVLARYAHANAPSESCFVDADTLAMSGVNDKYIEYRSLAGNLLATVPCRGLNATVACSDLLAIHPDDQGELVLRAVQLPSAARRLVQADDHPVACALSSDGRIAAVALTGGIVRLLDAVGGHLIAPLNVGAAVRSMYFDAQTLHLAVVTNEHAIQWWNLADLSRTCSVPVDGTIRSFALAPSGKTACLSLQNGPATKMLDLSTVPPQITPLDIPFLVIDIAASSRDGQFAFVGPEGGQLWELSPAPHKISDTDLGPAGAARIAFINGSNAFVTGSATADLKVWRHASSPAVFSPLKSGGQTYRSWSSMGNLIMLRNPDALSLIDPLEDSVVRKLSWSRELGTPQSANADGRRFLTLGDAGVNIVDWDLPKRLRLFEQTSDTLADARWLTTAGLGRSISAYPDRNDRAASIVEDAYGLWATGDRSHAHDYFANSIGLTQGAKLLLIRATVSAEGTN